MNKMKIHVKKCIQPYFRGVQDSHKNYEIRLNDCEYSEGDLLIMREWHHLIGYSGEVTFHRIGWMTDFEQKNNYVVFSLIHPTIKELNIMFRKMIEIEEGNK
jgi:hypothetical protein